MPPQITQQLSSLLSGKKTELIERIVMHSEHDSETIKKPVLQDGGEKKRRIGHADMQLTEYEEEEEHVVPLL